MSRSGPKSHHDYAEFLRVSGFYLFLCVYSMYYSLHYVIGMEFCCLTGL